MKMKEDESTDLLNEVLNHFEGDVAVSPALGCHGEASLVAEGVSGHAVLIRPRRDGAHLRVRKDEDRRHRAT